MVNIASRKRQHSILRTVPLATLLIMAAMLTDSLSSAKPTATTMKLGKRSGDACYSACKTMERVCYESIEKNNEGEGMQEMVVCMQGTDSCKRGCDESLSRKRNIVTPSNDVDQKLFDVDGSQTQNNFKR